jgi:predicted helicase
VEYPHLDSRIRSTYADRSTATLKNALYDSYIRAIRWASDRIGDSGVIGFVTNAGFLEANTADGLRQCLAEEFSSIYVFHLRGNARTAGELRRKEKDNVFGMGSRAPIAISLLVKNPEAEQHGQICFHDIGDDLTREEKLEKIEAFSSIAGITAANAWQSITPDQHGDWLNQRDDGFSEFIVMGDKKGDAGTEVLFENHSSGVKTNRDAWVYNCSRVKLTDTVISMIDFYNSEVERYKVAYSGLTKSKWPDVDSFLNFNSTRMSWTREVKQDLGRHKTRQFVPAGVVKALYRPFTKTWMYFNQHFNNCVYQMPRIFPDEKAENLVICVSGIGARSGFSALMANAMPNLHTLDTGQCFPLYLYDDDAEQEKADTPSTMDDLFGTSPPPSEKQRTRRDAITDEGLGHFTAAYPGEVISKEDVFFYVYGLLHSPDYRERYADNLAKELPRIPCVKTAADFWAFSQAGRKLADLHLNYETVEPYPLTITVHGDAPLTDVDYRVEKMRYGKIGKEKDLTTVHYNNRITVSGIPLEAYEYIVNGKPALDWVMERQCVKTDKDSGIVNDANDWAVETLGNAQYPLELFQNVVTVGLETMKIVNGLSKLDIAAS